MHFLPIDKLINTKQKLTSVSRLAETFANILMRARIPIKLTTKSPAHEFKNAVYDNELGLICTKNKINIIEQPWEQIPFFGLLPVKFVEKQNAKPMLRASFLQYPPKSSKKWRAPAR